MIPENIKKLLKRWKVIHLSTSSKEGIPNLIAVECCGVVSDKILIADCHFGKTKKNLDENKRVAILTENNKEHYQIKGIAEYQTSGKYFDKIVKMLEGTGYQAKGVIAVSCDEIYDLDKYTKVL
ncbi:pyridoxamine 5'-phosphate oxidase family protein [Candidatus Pacearchaeota archaeon]|nr:pyridoxamine 5'-phosphate oxidase family protein [Candidatus Pacearchaeota archaeon]